MSAVRSELGVAPQDRLPLGASAPALRAVVEEIFFPGTPCPPGVIRRPAGPPASSAPAANAG
jgi:hypothetical protein